MNMDMDSSAELEPDDADTHFVEVDPTRRYGRYKKILGKGAFKTVYWAFDKLEGMEVAWNQVKVRDASHGHGDLERLYSEVHLLKTLKHKNIIKFYNYWVDAENNNINIITEIFTSGTLRQYRKRHKQVDVRAIKNWSRQILEGLFYLHSQDPPIIHRDLKCDNIFVNGGQGEVKIGDLGMAAILHQAHADTIIGTPEFMAPELYEEKYNELVDIYSFGMCLLEMMTFEYPYTECENAVQIYKKVSSGVKPAALDKVKDPCVRQFIDKCLTPASERLSARELLKDPFLQNEGECEIMDCSWLISQGNDFKEGKTVLKEPYMNGSFHKLSLASEQGLLDRGSFKAVEDLKLHSNSNAIMGVSMHQEPVEVVKFGLDSYMEAGGSTPSAKEVSERNRDIRVKGKRKDDNTIFLGLRIADSEGYVRNIHFPFDIEADTAMIVASEMVAELDLSDQDVTTIAELMDVEIASLVPEWKPGVSFDDASDDYSHVISEDNTFDLTSDDDNPSGSFVLERLPSGRKYWLQCPVPLAGNYATKGASMQAPFKFPGSVNAGIKEASFHQPSLSSVRDISDKTNFSIGYDGQGLVTNNLDTRDHFKYPEHSEMIDCTGNVLGVNTDKDQSPPEIVKDTIVAESKNHPVSLQVDSNIKERLQDIRGKCLLKNDSKSVNCLNNFEFPSQQGDETTREKHSAIPFLEGTDAVRDPLLEADRRIARELEKLTMKQEHELKALKDRHEEALQVLMNQLRQKGCTGRNCFSETSDLQQKLSIDRRSTLTDESRSQRLSLAEITAATATVNSINGLGMHHRSSSGDNCISNHNLGVQTLSSRFESVDFSRFDVNVNTQENRSDTVETSKSIAPVVIKEDLSVQGDESKTPSKSVSKRHSIGAIFSKKTSSKTPNNMETKVGKEMENETECKDLIRESVKNGSILGSASKDESNSQRVASSKKRTSAKERKQHAYVKNTGSSEPASLADLFKMEKVSWKPGASSAKKSFKQPAAGLQSKRADTVIEESIPTLAKVSNDVEKPRKPESLIKAYKNGFSRKDKSRSHQREQKVSQQSLSKSEPSESPKPKGNDTSYQLKKQIFEKSVDPSEAQTVQLIQKAKSPYKNSVKQRNMTIPLVMAFHL